MYEYGFLISFNNVDDTNEDISPVTMQYSRYGRARSRNQEQVDEGLIWHPVEALAALTRRSASA